MKLKYSELSIKNLKSFNQVDRTLIVKKLEYLKDNFTALKSSKKLRELKGTKHENQYRFTIARKIRAILVVENSELILLVLRVGLRKNIY